VVLLPELSRRVRSGDTASSRDAMNRAAEFCLALTLPSAVALIVVPGLVAAVLFEHGAFTASDTAATAAALAIYAFGLPSFVLQKVLQPAYFAREDTRTPLRYAVVSMVVNLVIAVGGAPVAGYLAAAVGTSVAGWVNLILLWRGARQFGDAVAIDARLAARWPRILGASVLMGVLVLGLAEAQAALLPGWRAVGLALIVVTGAVGYAAAAAALGAFRPSDIRAAMSRGRRA
jgi:putative peptidoglycan lipid II flippase